MEKKNKRKCKELTQEQTESLARLIAEEATRGIDRGVTAPKRTATPRQALDMVF